MDTFYSRPQESQKQTQRPQTRLEPVSLESWDTTTDAIAAVLAKHIGATELILLKSCEVDQRLTLAELAEAEIVDRSFPAAAVGIKSVSIEKLDDEGRAIDSLKRTITRDAQRSLVEHSAKTVSVLLRIAVRFVNFDCLLRFPQSLKASR